MDVDVMPRRGGHQYSGNSPRSSIVSGCFLYPMISSPEIGPLIEIKIHSQQEWRYAFEKIKTYGICGLTLGTAEIGSSVHTINIISIALPDKTVYISDCSKSSSKGMSNELPGSWPGFLSSGASRRSSTMPGRHLPPSEKKQAGRLMPAMSST